MANSKNAEYVTNCIRQRKKDLINVLGGQCCICGFNQFQEALDFHHVNPNTKEFGIGSSNAVTKALNKQLIEVKKCVLLCANCHRGVHAGILTIPEEWQNFYNEDKAQKLLENLEQKLTRKIWTCERCGKQISKGAKHCPECASLISRKADRPERIELKKMIRTMPFTHIAKKYGVSDNSVRKWCKLENLPYKKTEIQNYSDKEWEAL